MADRGYVYGVFVSDPQRPSQGAPFHLSYRVEERDMGGLLHQPTNSGFLDIFHGERIIGSCGLSFGGSYWYDGKNHAISPATASIHSISFDGASKAEPSVPGLADAANSLLRGSDANRILIFVEDQIPHAQHVSARLPLIGRFEKGPSGRFVLDGGATLLSRARASFRSVFPLIASSIYSAMESRSHKRLVLEGMLSGARTRVLYSGPESLARFYSGLILSPCDSFTSSNLPARSTDDPARSGFDLSIKACGQGGEHPQGEIMMPGLVRSAVRLPIDASAITRTLVHSAKSDIAKIEKAGFSSTISNDPLDFLLFYHTMHIPMILARHKSRANIFSIDQIGSAFREGHIIFVKKGPLHLGGAVLDKLGGRLRLRYMGILDGSISLTRSGVNSALIFFSMRDAVETGYRLLDMGMTASLGVDGVAWFKKKWGAVIEPEPEGPILRLRFKDDEVKSRFLTALDPVLLTKSDGKGWKIKNGKNPGSSLPRDESDSG
jgi:hypothetical protein